MVPVVPSPPERGALVQLVAGIERCAADQQAGRLVAAHPCREVQRRQAIERGAGGVGTAVQQPAARVRPAEVRGEGEPFRDRVSRIRPDRPPCPADVAEVWPLLQGPPEQAAASVEPLRHAR